MSINTREIIVNMLYTLDTEDKKSHLLIRDVLAKYDYLDIRDKAFIKRVTQGTISSTITLDYIIDTVSSKPIAKCKPMIRAILRMSTYQIVYMDKVPDSAACDEAVKLCRKLSFAEFCPFVNGVLRTVSVKKQELCDFETIEDRVKRLSIKHSMPEWIVKMLQKEQKDTEALLAGLGRIRPTSVRFTDTTFVDETLEKWKQSEINFEKSTLVEDAYLIDGFEGMETVPGFLEGYFIVQDESSMLSALATGVKNGDALSVIDVCAAPGGKSCAVASIMKPNGHVRSFDVSELKVSLIDENISRLKLSNIDARVKDATEFDPDLEKSADIVIADVPCSGLGVIARKHDLKYKVTNEMMKDICLLQKDIINNVWKYVKPGGVLIYSTCTIHKAENEKMVRYILENLPFKGDSLKQYIPSAFAKERDCDYAIQFLPNTDGTDGFFVARFIRNEE